jgi:hypothetical protein
MEEKLQPLERCLVGVGGNGDVLPTEDDDGALRADNDSDVPSGGGGTAGTICGSSSVARGSKGVEGTLGTGDFSVVDGLGTGGLSVMDIRTVGEIFSDDEGKNSNV